MSEQFNIYEFSFRFGQRVRVRPPHPEAGATGEVMNAYLFNDGREEVFVSVPGGVGEYNAHELEDAPTHGAAGMLGEG